MIDVPVIDAHHHLALLTLGYPWLAESAPVDRYHGDDRSLRHDYLVSDYRQDLDGLPVVASVHIENGAADPLTEAEWIGQVIAESAPLPSVHVARADLSDPAAPALLEQYAAMPHVRGIRHILNWHPDSRFSHTDRPGIISEPGWRANFARLAGLGLSFDLQVFADQLPHTAALVREHPATAVILDHAGMPLSRDADYLRSWRSGMRELAEAPHVTVKISALGTTDHRWQVASIRPLVLETIDIFGPDRVMFASNFPVDGMYSSLPQLFGAFDQITQGFSRNERKAMFGVTAARSYRIETAR
ncbi:MAG: amidohydrolase family protein [Propionibacteriaceae bacterium]|nr:amidohydrolase family protein [Propionibacteriaceae bacterium]